MINRTKDNLAAKLNRMSEFYSKEDLDDWTTFLEQKGYKFQDGITFLDAQTRVNYTITNGRHDPCIYEYMGVYDSIHKNKQIGTRVIQDEDAQRLINMYRRHNI